MQSASKIKSGLTFKPNSSPQWNALAIALPFALLIVSKFLTIFVSNNAIASFRSVNTTLALKYFQLYIFNSLLLF